MSMVSWQDYAGVEGFGQSSSQDVADLNKALSAGASRDPPGSVTAGDGFSLRVESLDRVLKNLTYRMEHIEFWRAIPKRPAYNTVEEYNVLSSYGTDGIGPWIAEGGLPENQDSSYERKHVYVKFLGVTGAVTHVMSLVRPAHGNVIAQEAVNKTMHLLKLIERALYFGRSDLDSVQWDGLEKLIEDGTTVGGVVEHRIDMRGQPLSEDAIVDAALKVMDAPAYGMATHLYLNPRAKADLVKGFFPRARFDQFTKTSDGNVGLNIAGVETPAGVIRLVPDVFLDDGLGSSSAVPGSAAGDAAKRPGTPVAGGTATTTPAATTPASQFGAADAGDYIYKVVAVNRFGRSAPATLPAAATTVAAGDEVIFSAMPAAGASATAGAALSVSHYEVYRTLVNGAAGTERAIMRVANTAGIAQTVFHDYNDIIPGTTKAFLVQQDSTNLAFTQLAPMVKIPLATIDTSIRWMQLLYGALMLFTPRHNIIFRNIGRAAGSVA